MVRENVNAYVSSVISIDEAGGQSTCSKGPDPSPSSEADLGLAGWMFEERCFCSQA